MISAQQIRSMSSDAAEKAKKEGTEPLVMRTAEYLQRFKERDVTNCIPFLGDYVPEGFYIKDEWFVDSSGFGKEGEPSLTIDQFFKKLFTLKLPFGLAVTEAGEFQVYVGIYGVN